MIVVDAANFVGSRPDGWWRDRPGAARRLVEELVAAVDAGHLTGPLTVVLEGQARRGVPAGSRGAIEVVHAGSSGDDAIVGLVAAGEQVATVVTADRGLGERVRSAGGAVVGPGWLRERLEAL